MKGEYKVYESQYSTILNRKVNSNYKFDIVEFAIVPTRQYGYTDMVNRAFYANITNDATNSILNEVIRRGEVNENSSTTNNIIGVGARPISLAYINGGWRDKRYTFRLAVRCTPLTSTLYNSRNTSYELILTGYSDPSSDFAIDNGGGSYTVDTNLTFHINNMRRLGLSGGDGTTITSVVSSGVSTPSAFTQNDTINTSLAPGEIVDSLKAKDIAMMYNGTAISNGSNPHNTTLSFSKNHFIGKGYLNDMVNSIISGVNTTFETAPALADTFGSHINGSIYGRAGTLMANQDIASDPFVMALSEYAGNIFGTYGDPIFTLAILSQLDPTFSTNRITYYTGDEHIRFASDNIITASQTESLTGANIMHAVATELHNTIMSLMATKFLSNIELHMGNTYVFNGIGGQFEPWLEIPSTLDGRLRAGFSYSAATVPDELAFRHLYGAVRGYFTTVIDPLLSAGGTRKYTAIVMADNVNDTTIVLNFEDQGDVVYRFPTFADMAFSPLVADGNTKEQMVTNMGSLATTLIDNLSSNYKPMFK